MVDRADGDVPAHAHDWPVLSIFVLGGYRNTTELGEVDIAGPSAVLYQPGAAHANRVGGQGFEQIEIEFDPGWAGVAPWPIQPVCRWIGGLPAAKARALSRSLLREPAEPAARLALGRFIEGARGQRPLQPAAWIRRAEGMLREDSSLTVGDLARRVGRHPAWVGAAYARHQGEGVLQTAARFRIERAARLLRETDQAPAGIAADAGFCDQSHMIRAFRRVLGRTPSDVRADRTSMRQGGGQA